MTLLELRDVRASYGESLVLRGMSLEVKRGTVVSLLGRNGMGKSTTVKTIVGALAPSGGLIKLHGQPLSGTASWRIAQLGIGWVPEGRRIFAALSVEENLRVVARPPREGSGPGWDLATAYAMFPRLQERKRNLGSELSGGEQQMLAIARALSTNPELLILDEATEGLAPLVRAEIWAALRQLKVRGQSILIIDKHLAAISKLADYHYVIEKGQVVWSGDSDALQRDMEGVRRLLSVSG